MLMRDSSAPKAINVYVIHARKSKVCTLSGCPRLASLFQEGSSHPCLLTAEQSLPGWHQLWWRLCIIQGKDNDFRHVACTLARIQSLTFVVTKVFLPSLLVPIFVLILGCVHLYVSYKRKMADSVWEVDEKELAVSGS